jgi:uncharacterized protein YcbX
MTKRVGTVTALWRYPVASMGGETVESVEIDTGGVVGDRGWGVYATGEATAALAARGRKWNNLLQAQARFAEPPKSGVDCPPAEIGLPDGTVLQGDVAAVDAGLSALLGHDVVLRRVGGATADDGDRLAQAYEHAPIHLLTTASLDRLAALYPEGAVDIRRFRANILVGTRGMSGFIENGWLGRRLQIGAVTLEITEDSRRCAMTILAQGDLPRDRGILDAITRHNGVNLGVYASVVVPGVIFSDDVVTIV